MAWPDIIPHIRYEDAPAMLDWLEEAFGFTRRVVYEEGAQIVHAEVTFGTGLF
ncbi:MAG: glyoxalase, partial [Actinobacteria bacterium]